MIRWAGVALCLALSPAVAADKYLTATDVPLSLMVQIPDHGYTFEPKDDITTAELAQILKVMLPALACRNGLGCDILSQIDGLPDNVRRHFVYHKGW